ncbi:MAG: FAD-dependent oxidoreductase, partial [Pseudomonadota bacterium]|nr:FAD-dependent oxidoreductase [Pseudomonadota bacterium]
MHSIVVGGGIIGATTAHACLRRGHEVTLLEAGDALAGGTSYANGGQIAVSESAPWSQPGLPMKMLARSWQADAPFRLRLRADPAQWRWLLAFLANSRAGPHHAGRMRNLALGRYS